MTGPRGSTPATRSRRTTGPAPRRSRSASSRTARTEPGRSAASRPRPTARSPAPHSVFAVLRRHFSRYTPEMVQQICGIPTATFERVAETLCENSGRERTSAIAYAVGWTQRSVGVQTIRAASIVQLLLGNIGRPGGGILALRGHASIQGSTDIPTLYNILPGYLPMPHVRGQQSLAQYLKSNVPQTGWWGHGDAFMTSFLKAWWGEHASADNDFCFDYLPRISGDHSHYTTVKDMCEGKVDGYFVMGENPAVGSANARLQRLGLRNLKWLVVRDMVEVETAAFWRNSPETESGEISPEGVATEVFLMPAAAHTEKSGTFTNTQRLLQWRHVRGRPSPLAGDPVPGAAQAGFDRLGPGTPAPAAAVLNRSGKLVTGDRQEHTVVSHLGDLLGTNVHVAPGKGVGVHHQPLEDPAYRHHLLDDTDAVAARVIDRRSVGQRGVGDGVTQLDAGHRRAGTGNGSALTGPDEGGPLVLGTLT